MINIQKFRDDPEAVRQAISRKKFKVDFEAVTALDVKRRQVIQHAEAKRMEHRAASKEVGQFKDKKSPEFQQKIAAMKALSAVVKEQDVQVAELEREWKALMLSIPNMPHESVPTGNDEEGNQVIEAQGETGGGAFPHAIPHWDISGFEQAVDFAHGVSVTGAGFPFYIGDMARLLRSLITFFLDEAVAYGAQEVLAPLMVNAASATATGQLPDKEGQMYHVGHDDLYLIPTGEVPITNFYRDHIFDEKDLPVYRCGYTPCFRREAGSWGRHVRGLNRLHQFDKVEIVKWVHPDHSFLELDKLRKHAEGLLQKLGLPYRVLLMCTGDIGFPHAKQYDIEVWAAGQKSWLEVSSCSNFTDFQARRAGIRYRPRSGGKTQILHTLNGSALALPRVMAAILENNLQEDGSVLIPECLHRYFGKDKMCPTGRCLESMS